MLMIHVPVNKRRDKARAARRGGYIWDGTAVASTNEAIRNLKVQASNTHAL